MKNDIDGLIGRWETESSVILEISKSKANLKVRAFDKDDNEEIIVSNVSWDGKYLRFETFIPSTKYRTRNCLHLKSKKRLIQELTFWEVWRKLPDKANAKRSAMGTKRK